MAAISKTVYPYLLNDVANVKVINCDKYEFWLYQQLSYNCSAGHLFVDDSNKYRNFDDDLVDNTYWQDKENIIKNLGFKRLIAPLSDTLDELETELEYWIERVNKRIDAGENPHIKLSGKRSGNMWSLPYSKLDESESRHIFKDLPRVGIADVLVECKIKPTKKIKKELILGEEDNIKKIMVSLATKNATQSVIITKLSSHKRRNRTKAALCELDNIIRSIHTLRYIDDITYRQSIQKALNQGESYNKLRRAISYANEGKLNVHSEMSQQIYNECARFLANNIILYNARLLSNLLIKLEKAGKTAEIEKLKRISPVAWAHINIYGRYEFNKEFLNLEFNELIKLMSIDNIGLDES